MIYEKTNDAIYEISCFSVNMILTRKKEEVIPEIQSIVRKLSGLLVEPNLK